LKPGQRVLDLGTGIGAVTVAAAGLVGAAGRVTAVDISPDMLALSRRQLVESGRTNVDLREGRAEQLPADSGAFDVVLASLSLMYAIDRGAAAREIERVLRPGVDVSSRRSGPRPTDAMICSADRLPLRSFSHSSTEPALEALPVHAKAAATFLWPRAGNTVALRMLQ